jgi:hypothetical protein
LGKQSRVNMPSVRNHSTARLGLSGEAVGTETDV